MAKSTNNYCVMAFSLTREQALFIYKNCRRYGEKSALIQQLLQEAMQAKEQVEVEETVG